MEFYRFGEIKSRANCLEIAREIGLKVDKHGRCQATWRGGSRKDSVAINAEGWHDFATEESGSVIDLVAAVMFNGNKQSAQEWLGRRLGLQPTKPHIKAVDTDTDPETTLIRDGWERTNVYTYHDAEGKPAHMTYRFRRGNEKCFRQRSSDGKWSLEGKETFLYNLPAVMKSKWVVIVEGEKDADNLIKIGIPATTAPMGAKKWKPGYTACLSGKKIVILPDNDQPGRDHANLIIKEIYKSVHSVKVITLSDTDGGDVSDWMEAGGTKERLMALIKDANTVDPVDAEKIKKAAGKVRISNYELTESEDGKTRKTPITIDRICEAIFAEMRGFPRRVGGKLFDQDKASRRITYLNNQASLFAWIKNKTRTPVDWDSRGTGMVSKAELFEAISMAATEYDSISGTPDYPIRSNVYYSHPELPMPDSEEHRFFYGLVDFFNPIDAGNWVMLKAFLAAPIFFIPMIPRPSWIIDAACPGAGKSTLASITAHLYGNTELNINRRDFSRELTLITKRCVSAEGRQKRIVLIDNVVGAFRSEELADMITRSHITGMAPYGHGEESRENNLTYVITSNNATIDNDMAIRSYFVKLDKVSEYSEKWRNSILSYIDQNRFLIFADIIDMLKNPKVMPDRMATRFPEFERTVLCGVCEGIEEYQAAIETIRASRESANIDGEYGAIIEDAIAGRLTELGIDPDNAVFIQSQIVDEWARKPLPKISHPLSMIKNLAREGHAPCIDPAIDRFPRGKSPLRRRGIMWTGKQKWTDCRRIVGITRNEIRVIPIGNDNESLESSEL